MKPTNEVVSQSPVAESVETVVAATSSESDPVSNASAGDVLLSPVGLEVPKSDSRDQFIHVDREVHQPVALVEAATRAGLAFEQTRTVIERVVLKCQHSAIFSHWGEQFTEVLPPQMWPSEIRPGPLGQCFQTSGSYARTNKRFTYMEGWAIRHGYPAQHAWLFDAKLQRIIDPTWIEPAGQWYFGVGVSRAVISKFCRAGVWPILDAFSDRDEGLSEIFVPVLVAAQTTGLTSTEPMHGVFTESQTKAPRYL